MCIDTNGNTVARSIAADTANRGKTTTTDNSGVPFPPCEVNPIEQLRYEWLIFISALGVAAVLQTFGTLYAAMLPLQHGDEGPVDLETLTYEERAVVVTTLWLVSIQIFFKMPRDAVRGILAWLHQPWGSSHCLCPRATRQAMYAKYIAVRENI